MTVTMEHKRKSSWDSKVIKILLLCFGYRWVYSKVDREVIQMSKNPSSNLPTFVDQKNRSQVRDSIQKFPHHLLLFFFNQHVAF